MKLTHKKTIKFARSTSASLCTCIVKLKNMQHSLVAGCFSLQTSVNMLDESVLLVFAD